MITLDYRTALNLSSRAYHSDCSVTKPINLTLLIISLLQAARVDPNRVNAEATRGLVAFIITLNETLLRVNLLLAA